jgi:hypothetical protein
MTKTFRRALGLSIVLLVAVMVLVKYPAFAQKGDDHSEHSANARVIEGVWDVQVTIRDCQSGNSITGFRAMDLFIRGGSVVDTNSAPTATRGPGLGSWDYSGGRSFNATLRFFMYKPDGTFLGVRRVAQDIEVNEAGDGWTSTVNTITTVNGTDTIGCATAVATRFQ